MTKQKIQLEKYTAAYTIRGQGIPVILLHGFFGDSGTLDSIIQKLPEKSCCLGLDLLGFGESSKPKIDYLIEHQVEFLQQFIAAKNLQEFYLIGYSYGGWVASAYAIAEAKYQVVHQDLTHHPNIALLSHPKSSIKGLVLIAPAGIRDDSFVGRYTYLKPLLWETPLVDFLLNRLSPLATFLGKQENLNFIRQVRQSLMSQPVAKAMLTKRLKPEDAIDTVEKEINQIKVPTLVIAGENDQQIPLWHSQTYADHIPDASLEIIPNADHDVVHTHGQKIADLIKKLLTN